MRAGEGLRIAERCVLSFDRRTIATVEAPREDKIEVIQREEK